MNQVDWERFNQLVSLSESGQREEAIRGLRGLVRPSETSEDNGKILLIIGACEKELGRFEEARNTLNEARSLADKNSWVHPRAIFFDASIDIMEGNWKGGLEKLSGMLSDYRSLLYQPEQKDLLEETQRKRGMAFYELGRLADARPLLEEAAKVSYEKPTTLHYLGRCYYDLGDLQLSENCFREALDLGLRPPYQPGAHYYLGLIYYAQRRYAWAIREFEWCLEHDVQGRVPRKYVLTWIINASKKLGQAKDAERYSKMLQEL